MRPQPPKDSAGGDTAPHGAAFLVLLALIAGGVIGLILKALGIV